MHTHGTSKTMPWSPIFPLDTVGVKSRPQTPSRHCCLTLPVKPKKRFSFRKLLMAETYFLSTCPVWKSFFFEKKPEKEEEDAVMFCLLRICMDVTDTYHMQLSPKGKNPNAVVKVKSIFWKHGSCFHKTHFQILISEKWVQFQDDFHFFSWLSTAFSFLFCLSICVILAAFSSIL